MTQVERILVMLSGAQDHTMVGNDLMQRLGKKKPYAPQAFAGTLVVSGDIRIVKSSPIVYQLTNKGMERVTKILKENTTESINKLDLVAPKAPVPMAKPIPNMVAAEEPKPVDKPEPIKHTSLDSAIDALATALVSQVSVLVEQKVGAMLETMITDKVAASIEKVAAGLNKPTAAVKQALPRVSIIGLLPDQARMLEKEFSGALALRFAPVDSHSSMIKSTAAASDITFLMTDKISHNTTELVKSVTQHFQLVSGGMTSMRDALTKFYVEGSKA